MKPGFLNWIDDRTGWLSQVWKLLRYPVPEHAHRNFLFTLGGLTVLLLLVQAVTGLLLAIYYVPSVESAYLSTDYIQFEVPFGWLVRGVHHWGASVIIVFIVLHLSRTYLFGAYKRPREFTWILGVILMLVMFAFSFTGYLLPWDQMAYWATRVGTELIGSVPLIGTQLMALARGGIEMGQLTLTRFYAVHVLVLPAILLMMLAAHLVLMRRHGLVGPWVGESKPEKSVFFFPTHMFKEALIGFGFLIILIAAAYFFPAPLGAEADPTDTSMIPRPEWYFLFFFQLLKYFPGWLEPVATVVIPIFVIGSFLLLPFIDTDLERRPWKKPITTGTFIFYSLAVVVLTILAL